MLDPLVKSLGVDMQWTFLLAIFLSIPSIANDLIIKITFPEYGQSRNFCYGQLRAHDQAACQLSKREAFVNQSRSQAHLRINEVERGQYEKVYIDVYCENPGEVKLIAIESNGSIKFDETINPTRGNSYSSVLELDSFILRPQQ